MSRSCRVSRFYCQLSDPALRPQITQLARDILAGIEQQPKFRRNNLAYAMTVNLAKTMAREALGTFGIAF